MFWPPCVICCLCGDFWSVASFQVQIRIFFFLFASTKKIFSKRKITDSGSYLNKRPKYRLENMCNVRHISLKMEQICRIFYSKGSYSYKNKVFQVGRWGGVREWNVEYVLQGTITENKEKLQLKKTEALIKCLWLPQIIQMCLWIVSFVQWILIYAHNY